MLKITQQFLKTFLALGLILSSLNARSTLITHNGFTYGTVTSPYTGRVWLDRNLGASRVCTAYNDSACYGDYYQWGRDTDGHEKADSQISTTYALDINNAGNKFILVDGTFVHDWTELDTNGSIRYKNWSSNDGSSVCPVGFVVPESLDFTEELEGGNIISPQTLFDSFLKIPSAGLRDATGSISNVGTADYIEANLWVNQVADYMRLTGFNVTNTNGTFIGANISSPWEYYYGFNVRCVSYLNNIQAPIPNAGQNETTYKGNAVTLSASNSTDSDGNITAYLWSENGTVLSTDVNFTKYDFSVGVHTITLKVTDNDNASAEANVTVTINEFPQENIYANGTFTNSIDYLNTKRVYTFTVDEKSQVNIKASSSAMKVGAWITDANNTKISRLLNWEAGDKGQFAYEGVLDTGTYKVEFFPQNYGSSGDFTFTFDTKAYSTLVQNPWSINIPKNITIANNEIVNISLDIQANSGVILDSKDIEISSNDLPNGFSIIKRADRYNEKYTFSLEGKVETTDDFAITLHITDGNITKEHIINFSVQNIMIDGIIGDGIGEKMVIKQDENNVTKPFKVAFNIRGVDENNIESVICQFSETPILSKEIFSKTYYRENNDYYGKYICDIGERAFTRGASSSEDFMNKLMAIDDSARFLTIVINLKDGTSVKKKIMKNIPIVKIGGYISIKYAGINGTSSFYNGFTDVSLYDTNGNAKLYDEKEYIKHATFNVDYGDIIVLRGGRWTIDVNDHEMYVNLDTYNNKPFVLQANKDLDKNETILNLDYIKLGEKLELYLQKTGHDKLDNIIKIAHGVGNIWTKATHLRDNLSQEEWMSDNLNTPAIAAIRGTTFKMTLTNHGIDYDLYEGAIDINNSGKITKLKTMQSYKSDTATMKKIADLSIPLAVKTYFDNTSLYQADLNTTVSKLDISTNRDDASYILVGDNVRFGSGKLNSIDNITEGNYTLKFLPAIWTKKPSDINMTFDAQNIKENITSTYQKIVDVTVNGVSQDRRVDVNISNGNIKIDQLEDASISSITTIGDKNSSINFNTIGATIDVDNNATTTVNLTLSKPIKITVDKLGKVKATISGALLPKENFPLGTEVKIVDDKVRLIVPMDKPLEF